MAHSQVRTPGVGGRRVAQGQPWVWSLGPLWAIRRYLKAKGGVMTSAGQELQHRPPGHEQAAPRVVATEDTIVINLASSIFLQLSEGKRHKIKMYTLQKEIKREKSEFPPAAVNKLLLPVSMPMCQADRQGLQSGKEAPSGKSPLHRRQQTWQR